MWPRIREILPDAVLNIYTDVNHKWSNEVAPDELKEIKVLLKLLSGINYHGWVSKSTLAEAWSTADYWLYPCKFEETFCLTALEAAITKTYPITNNLAALNETVSNRGLIIHGNPLTQEWQDDCIEAIKNISMVSK
jgi:glycosyltransferase involved in cell wall biosynthesis